MQPPHDAGPYAARVVDMRPFRGKPSRGELLGCKDPRKEATVVEMRLRVN